MNDFQKRYKNYADKDLLKIIEEPDQYQPLAVEAALSELSKRVISDSDVESVKQEILLKKSIITDKQNKILNYENKAKNLGLEILETINPIQNESPTINRKINLLVIVFGLSALYLIFEGFGTFNYLFSTNFTIDSLILIGHILPGLILLISVFLFWKRKTFVWILLSVSFLYFFINAVVIFGFTITWAFQEYSDNGAVDSLVLLQDEEYMFPFEDSIEALFTSLFWASTLWFINSAEIKTVFQIGKNEKLKTIGIAIFIFLLSLIGLF